jgi:5-carboxymethyl-2-hydroxymuconate isomerase
MPHLSIEHSANLDRTGDLPGLCLTLRATLMETRLFEEGAIRVRTLPCPHYAIADLHPDNAFAALLLRIGAGRSESERERLGSAVITAAQAHFARHLAQLHFALSLDIVENDPKLSWKTNTIHPRLRVGG